MDNLALLLCIKKCELCPSKHGALKRTDNSGWAHVVCALYIPEVRFGNVTTMEPIQLQLIPTERFSKSCYICEEKGKASSATVGACMQCNKAGCKQQFHVTCAQSLGLLCEEAGNYLDNVNLIGTKPCCSTEQKKGGNVKTIPPYKPVSTENHLSDSNSEKEAEGSATTKTTTTSSSSQLSSSKRKTSSSSKTSSSKTSSSTKGSSSSSHQKTVHNSSSKSSDKLKVSSSSVRSSAKSVEDSSVSVDTSVSDNKTDTREVKLDLDQNKTDVRDSKSSKKRRTNSRTPTPVALVPSDSVSVVTSTSSTAVAENLAATASAADKKGGVGEIVEKQKKVGRTL
ncbi:hypothetical protein GEV33_010268 [Tenebrio molitor]|uniref:PHD-type domain-containing protein n=1 Tax=Tenebrio molitor TaxID=7067 RepID=A0A8J6HDI9_TENMO|nr:hypothetical protein GEV33_010268 [Tenebrio molitor]